MADEENTESGLPEGIDWDVLAKRFAGRGGILGDAFWANKKRRGANPKFETPEDLLEAVVDYFDSLDSDGLYEQKAFAYQGEVVLEDVKKMRAPTIRGLCFFLGVRPERWADWRRTREDLSRVIEWADDWIYQRKYEGASAGLLNPNIIARDLGLTDKSEINHKSTDGSMTPTRHTEDDLYQRAQRLGLDPVALGLRSATPLEEDSDG